MAAFFRDVGKPQMVPDPCCSRLRDAERSTPINVLREFPLPFEHPFGHPFGCTEEYALNRVVNSRNFGVSVRMHAHTKIPGLSIVHSVVYIVYS
jgi:hypothetical protein